MTNASNNRDSQNDVISTVTHLLAAFEEAVINEMPQVGVIYDADFSYETGLNKFIEKNHYNETQIKPSELFIYNRTITEDSIQGIGMRAKNASGQLAVGSGDILRYSCAYSEYDLNFMYCTHSIELAEKFEVVYNSNSGISSIRELLVKMGELGDFKYYLNPLPLTDFSIVGDGGVTYKGVMGIIRVRGFFFVFEGKGKAIQTINQKLYGVVDLAKLNENELLANLEVI